MQVDRLQLQRFELKYLTTESVAVRARDFVRAYLKLDEHGVGRANNAYPVHSIYVDSPALALYQQTVNGDKNRYKLRIRFYNDAPEAPLFLEIKRRSDNAILKQRCPVYRKGIAAVLQGRLPDAAHIASTQPKHLAALQRFVKLVCELQARPVAHVAYCREAWISPHDNSVRVTIDREVRFEADPTLRFCTTMTRPVLVFGESPVLEIKFTGRFPMWFGEFVRAFGLTQRSAAKYADGVELFGEARLRSALSGPLPAVAAGADGWLRREVA